MANWNQVNRLEVKATIDNVRDGDHRLHLDVVANIYNQPVGAQITTTATAVTVGTVQVCMHTGGIRNS